MTTYYIDNSASNASDKNAGTSATSAFASLAALSKISLQPGDTVAIKAGTVYNVNAPGAAVLTITASGTADKPITFTSYGDGNKPIINNSATTNIYSDAVALKGAHYVTIDGIAVHNAGQAAINVDANSSHIVVENGEFTNVGEGVLLNGTNNLVTGNYIHDLHLVKDTPINTTNAATIAATNNDDYGANGVVIAASNNEVSFNKIVNAKSHSYDYGTDGGGIELFNKQTNVSIHDNYVSGSQGFLEAGGTKATLSNISIYNNVSLNNGNFIDIHNGGGSFASTFLNVQVFGNTVIDQTNAGKEMATIFFDAPGATAAQVNVHDNIISLNGGDSVFKQEGTYHSDNLFYLQSSATHLYNDWVNTLGSGEKYGNPGLNDTADGNFTPTAAGLAQSVGAVISARLQAVISGTAITSNLAVSNTVVPKSVSFVATNVYDLSGNLTATNVTNVDGTKAVTSYVAGADFAVQQSFYGVGGALAEIDQYAASGSLVYRQTVGAAGTTTDHFNAAGGLTSENVLHTDASREVTNYGITGQSYASEHLTYSAAGVLVGDDRYAASGTLLSKLTVTATGTTTDTFSAAGTLLSENVLHGDGTRDYNNNAIVGQTYAKEHITYSAAGRLVEDDQYSASGTLLSKLVVNAVGTTTEKYSAAGTLLTSNVLHTDGTRDYTNYAVTGQSYTTQHYAYDAKGVLTEDDRYNAAGSLLYKQVVGATGTATDTYSTNGAHLTELVANKDGSKELWTYNGPNGSTEHDSFGTNGARLAVDITNTDGSHVTSAYAQGVTLTGYAGVSDAFQSFGGDTFNFATGSGTDTIKNFHAGNAAGHDVIQIDVPGIDSFAQLQALVTSPDHVSAVIHLGGSDTITLDHVAPSALTAADFQFAHHGALVG